MDKSHNQSLIYAEVTATKGATSLESLSRIYGVPISRAQAVKKLYHEKKFKFLWYSFFLVAILVCLIIAPSSYLACIETIVCILTIDFQGRAKITGQYFGIAECGLYALISFRSALYGEVIKSLAVNLPLTIFALVSWLKNSKESMQAGGASRDIKIRSLSMWGWGVATIVFVVVSIVSYFLLGLLNTKLLVLSAITFSISLIFKLLMATRFKEGWLFGLIQALISLILWGSNLVSLVLESGDWQSVLPIVVLDLAILTNAIYAYILWRAMFRKESTKKWKITGLKQSQIQHVIKAKQQLRNIK